MPRIQIALVVLLLLVAPGVSSSPDTSADATVENLDAATAAFAARDWKRAIELIEPMAAENPYSGKVWYFLGSAHYGAGNHAVSAEAYMRAAELGFQRGVALYNAACCYSLLGDTGRAIDTLEQAIQGHFSRREELLRTDTDLDNIRDTEAFSQRILPHVSEDMDRVTGWRIDLDYLHRRMETTHYDLYRNISREEWRSELDRIRNGVADMTDDRIIVELMALFARIGDGHTGVVLPAGGSGERPGVYDLKPFHALPVEFYLFADGLYVRSAARGYADIVGSRVVRIGNVTADEALSRVGAITQRDNSQQVKWIAPRYMSMVEVLHGLGIADDAKQVEIVVQAPDGREKRARIEPVVYDRETLDDLRSAVDMCEASAPLYLEDRGSPYWMEYFADDSLVYMHFDRVRDSESGPTIAEFTEQLAQFIEDEQVDALVIDVRLNHGGNNFLVKPLVSMVASNDRINQRGHLFMIIGRETFSACQNFTNRMQNETEVLFVGEPTASRPNFVGEGNPIVLPYTGLTVRGSSRYWQDSVSEDARLWVAPDFVAEVTSEDFRAGRDPALDTVRAYLANHRKFVEEQATR